ncbi:MAG TPA: Nramp family divalent metal transporter [Vicinamibacteria bacterium]|nr:Nramp family divalent metal transporter [Vicinamibacteria bacterium]
MKLSRFGPGLLVTAAFIGPGTIVTASRAGSGFGLALIWAVTFSTVATAVLQEMAARVGIVTRHGLSAAIRESFRRPLPRALALSLIVCAITLGNAAYETGNLLGASLGLEILSGQPPRLWAFVLALVSWALLLSGTYRRIQSVLVVLVIFMSFVFLATAALVRPSWGDLIRGLVPSIPEGSLLTVIALIGTTVVPYNLFLHASTVQEKWSVVPTREALTESRWDTALSVALGGLVTLAIVVNATPLADVSSPASIALQLEPVLGRWARTFFGLGLFAAGLTSAVTAPLAAAYATTGALGLSSDLRSTPFRLVASLVVGTGLVLSLFGGSPTEAIVLAQAANGLLLPVVAVFLLSVVNDEKLMQGFRNRALANWLGGLVVLVVSALGLFQVVRLLTR